MLHKFLAAPAMLAAASLAATPAAAVELPMTNPAPAEAASQYGPYVGFGGGWGWGGGHHGRHRGSTAGDILTGVLILGTIAAVANAASRARQRRSYPDRYPYPYPDRRPDTRYHYRPDGPPDGPRGIEGAADLCLREVERDARAREVTRVERTAGGWLVSGAMADGAAFSCSIGADGRIERLDVGGRARELGAAGPQAGDSYRSGRADQAANDATGPQPAYPGGPLPGEAVDSEVAAGPQG